MGLPLTKLRETYGIEYELLVSSSSYHTAKGNSLIANKQAHNNQSSCNANDVCILYYFLKSQLSLILRQSKFLDDWENIFTRY